MKGKLGFVVVFGALALQGCGLFTITDRYGNVYGDFSNYGNQYEWQLATCDKEMARSTIPEGAKKRAMECCMWRHGVPIDDPKGCEAPPYNG
jgi:hypothetical protein